MAQPNIDGFLVGGASLKPDFLGIIDAANKKKDLQIAKSSPPGFVTPFLLGALLFAPFFATFFGRIKNLFK